VYAPYGKRPDPNLLYGLVYTVAAAGALLWLPVIRAVRSRRRSAPVLAIVVATITAALAVLLFAATEYGAQIFPPLWGILAVLPPAAGILAVVLLRRRPGRVHRGGSEPPVSETHVTDEPGRLVLGLRDRLGIGKVMVVRVFVAGGTGVLGRRLVPQLVARGHQVTATTTSPAKLGLLAQLGADGVVMDGLDAVSVGEAVAKARPDAIVHQMTAISMAHAGKPDMKHFDRFFATTNRLRTEGTDHLLAAGEAADVSTFVAESFGSFNGIREGGWVKTEEDPPDRLTGTVMQPMVEAVLHLEDVVVKAGGAALRYGALYGPGATDDQVELVRKRKYPLVGRGTGYSSWVHLDDAASATVLAVEQNATGVFNIVDDEPAPASEWLPYLAACAGAKRPMRVPKWLARLLAGDLPVIMMTEGRGFSNAKAKRELGWKLRYPSWRQGFKEELA
jgi:nucleoside-diphosphate-sugar epimerase